MDLKELKTVQRYGGSGFLKIRENKQIFKIVRVKIVGIEIVRVKIVWIKIVRVKIVLIKIVRI
ncbi:MAG: hypothetical protein LBF22_09515 [Deltaproteobacteria bacterium]|jgi:hypothetical protein|nr:hypothetical protein [Deltaproteobacteria bacterium]